MTWLIPLVLAVSLIAAIVTIYNGLVRLNVLGNNAWANAFEDIYRDPPRWYTGPGGGQGCRPGTLTRSLGRLSAQAATVMASSPRSSGGSGFSGGGFSGGGFGGGGGGGF